jgi:hypothetical protein
VELHCVVSVIGIGQTFPNPVGERVLADFTQMPDDAAVKVPMGKLTIGSDNSNPQYNE